MKTILVTTTVSVPHLLALYRKYNTTANIPFIVIGDIKTPDPETYNFCMGLDNCHYYPVERQKALGYKCSELIGWSCIQRRSIGFLEALKMGADIIVTVDTDNYPLDPNYFNWFETLLEYPWSGMMARGRSFDPGQLLFPEEGPTVPHRGMPVRAFSFVNWQHVIDAKIGVAESMVLGDPDISAHDRISQGPSVHQVSELLRAGVVVHPQTMTVFNTQATAFIRKLTPATLLCPQFKRYDDIVASVICRRVMHDLNLYTHYGRPFSWQERHDHDLTRDMRDEAWGTQHIGNFADSLYYPYMTDLIGEQDGALGKTRAIYRGLKGNIDIPDGVVELGAAWCDDVETVL